MLTPDLVFIITTVLKSAVVVVVMLGMVAYSVVAERRFSALIQDRIGPNRVGIPLTNIRLGGLGQPIADGIKFLLKEELTPAHVNKFYYYLAPCLAMIPALLTVSVVPWGSFIDLRPVAQWVADTFSWQASVELIESFAIPAVIADLDVGILFVFAIVSLSVYGIVLAGWASNSKYPFLGGIRSSAQMISYELSMGLAVVPVFLLMGTMNLSGIVQYQADHGWLAFPIYWGESGLSFNFENLLIWPTLLVAFIMFWISAFAETNRLPFDLPECETELVGGYHTEYAAMKFALFFLGEYAAMLVVSAIMVTLFLGGWSLPLSWLNGHVPMDTPLGAWLPFFMGFVHVGVFIAKMAFFIFFFIWVRWSLPRFRYDQLMNIGWKVLIPLGLLNTFFSALLLAVQHGI